jgi:hypothetical protein
MRARYRNRCDIGLHSMEGEGGVAGVYGRDRATVYCHGWVFSIVVQFNYSVIGLRSFKNDLFVAEETPVRLQ